MKYYVLNPSRPELIEILQNNGIDFTEDNPAAPRGFTEFTMNIDKDSLLAILHNKYEEVTAIGDVKPGASIKECLKAISKCKAMCAHVVEE